MERRRAAARLALTMVHFTALRIALGATEAMGTPTGTKTVAAVQPPRWRSTGFGATNAASSLGAIFCLARDPRGRARIRLAWHLRRRRAHRADMGGRLANRGARGVLHPASGRHPPIVLRCRTRSRSRCTAT